MRGNIPPLPQYNFMAWCSVIKSTGAALPLPPKHIFKITYLVNGIE
jgi:hypothetical protein